jgi:hypothetical protein
VGNRRPYTEDEETSTVRINGTNESPGGSDVLSPVGVVCQAEVFLTGRSLYQRISTKYMVSECVPVQHQALGVTITDRVRKKERKKEGRKEGKKERKKENVGRSKVYGQCPRKESNT